MTIISTTVSKNPLEEMEQPSSSTKESEMWNVILGCNLQNNRIISVPFQGKPFNIPVIQVYAPATDVKEAEAGLGVQNEAGQRLAELSQENTLVLQQHKRTLHMDITKWSIRLIACFSAKDGEALYSQQKQGQELTVAQIMNSLLPNSDLNWRK